MDRTLLFESHYSNGQDMRRPAPTGLFPMLVPTRTLGRPSRFTLSQAEGTRHPVVVPLAVRDGEGALLAAAKEGDANAFAALVEPCAGMLHQVALGILRNEEDAQDAFQEALLCIHLDLRKFNGASKFSTWAYRVCVNRALMLLRSRKRRREDAMEVLLACHDRPGSMHPGAQEETLQVAPVAFTQLEQRQVRAEILKGLIKLTSKQQTVFLLKDMGDLNSREIALQLGVSLDVIRQRLHRARRSMRDHLDACGDGAFLCLGMAQAVSSVDERS